MNVVTNHFDTRIRVWDTRNLSQQQLGSIQAEFKLGYHVGNFCGSGDWIAHATQYELENWEILVLNIHIKEWWKQATARIELKRPKVCIQLNNSGDRIVVWTNLKELFVFDTSGGTRLLSVICEENIADVACSHDTFFVAGHTNGSISVFSALTGTLEATVNHSQCDSPIIRLFCSTGVSRPFSCVSCNSEASKWQMVVWDVISRETCVAFDLRPISDLEFASFGCTDSIIIGAGKVDGWDCRGVVVWELEMCGTANRLQAVVKSEICLTRTLLTSPLMAMCFNPIMNAIFYVDDDGGSIIVVDLGTGAEVVHIQAPCAMVGMQFVYEGGVVLL